MTNKLNSLFQSRRFYAAIIGILAVSFKEELQLDPLIVDNIVLIIASWIVGDSLNKTGS